jgi:hypothetical protein
MKIRVFAVDFYSNGGITYPKDKKLHDLCVAWCETALAKPVNLADFADPYRKLWAACEVDENDEPVRVEGMLGTLPRMDFPLVRFTSQRAAKALIDRANDHLHDQGFRGAEVFVFISSSETEEQRCPQWQDWLKAVGAYPAERYALTIK